MDVEILNQKLVSSFSIGLYDKGIGISDFFLWNSQEYFERICSITKDFPNHLENVLISFI